MRKARSAGVPGVLTPYIRQLPFYFTGGTVRDSASTSRCDAKTLLYRVRFEADRNSPGELQALTLLLDESSYLRVVSALNRVKER